MNINSNTQLSNVVAKRKKDGNFNIYEKYRKETYKAKTIWEETEMITEKGTVELGEHGLSKYFEFPKPIALIKKCLELGTDKNSIILDFFAGSGTTGQAVLELNREDAGNRAVILCTNNQNDICRKVTYKRLYNTINGYKDKKAIEGNLKYYKTDYIDRFNHEDEKYYITNELSKYIQELVQLENGIDIDNREVQVLFTDEEIDKFSKNKELVNDCNLLYVDTNALITEEQMNIFEENNITILYIPEYYFEDEIMEVEQW